MTTTVTVKTHDWPVSVTSNGNHQYREADRRGYGHQSSTEFVPKNSERTFNVTQAQHIIVSELHADATSLDHHDELTMASASADQTMLSGGAMSVGSAQDF